MKFWKIAALIGASFVYPDSQIRAVVSGGIPNAPAYTLRKQANRLGRLKTQEAMKDVFLEDIRLMALARASSLDASDPDPV